MRTAHCPDSQAAKKKQLLLLPLIILDSALAKILQGAITAILIKSRVLE